MDLLKLENNRFIDELYHHLLNRKESNRTVLESWNVLLTKNHCPKPRIISMFLRKSRNLYSTPLSTSKITTFSDKLRFILSLENSAFINLFYREVLIREATPDELEDGIRQLETGTTKIDLISNIVLKLTKFSSFISSSEWISSTASHQNTAYPIPHSKPVELTEYNFCTIVGKESYIISVLAYYSSLMKHTKNFKLWICCLNDNIYSTLAKCELTHAELINVEEFEDDKLKRLKSIRSQSEYCFTLKAPLIEHLLLTKNLDAAIYCDTDLFFFSDAKIIFEEWTDYSIFLCPHRLWSMETSKLCGSFQAGLVGFKNNQHGLKGLKWWKNKCYEGCHSNPDGQQFGDQKYLDDLAKSEGVLASNNLGVNVGIWNYATYDDFYNISKFDNKLYIDGQRLIVFHFTGLSSFSLTEFDLCGFISLKESKIKTEIVQEIYLPYLQTLQDIMKFVMQIDSNVFEKCLAEYSYCSAKNPYKLT